MDDNETANRAAVFTPARGGDDQPTVRIGPCEVYLWLTEDGTLTVNVVGAGSTDKTPAPVPVPVDLFIGSDFKYGYAPPPPPPDAPYAPKPWHGTERPEGPDETLAGAREAFFAGMAGRDPAELERDRQAAWTPRPGTWWAGTGEDGTCNCSDPRGATPGDQCFNCGYTLTAAQIERGDEIERRSPQAAADWNAANPGNDDQ
jgi:hypothetical protein